MSSPAHIAVIGGGVTGLRAAHALARQGTSVRLFESATRLGGPVHSTQQDGWLSESGPNSVQRNTDLDQLLGELNLLAEVREARPEARNRYILRGGKPVPAPSSPPGLLTSPLFGIGAKLRVFTEILKRPRTRRNDVSLADFISDHFGEEIVEYGVNPFVSGVYAGNPDKLSARHAFPSLWSMEREHGSIIRGQISSAKAKRARGESAGPPKIVSLAPGLGSLVDAMHNALPAGCVELNARVETLLPGERWSLVWQRDDQTHTETFDRVILAVPAAGLARMRIGSLGERPLAALADIEYPPVASLFLGYRREQVAHPLDGFGMLVPAAERRRILGVLFSSTLFDQRAPEGHVALTVMFGGSGRPDLGRADEATLGRIAAEELQDLLGVDGEPVYRQCHAWPRAIPQYNLGYERFLHAIEDCEHRNKGVLIGGHVRDGISLPNCLAAGRKLAERASA